MLTQMRVSDLAHVQKQLGLKLGWSVQRRLWRRDKDYTPFDLIERCEFFSDDMVRQL